MDRSHKGKLSFSNDNLVSGRKLHRDVVLGVLWCWVEKLYVLWWPLIMNWPESVKVVSQAVSCPSSAKMRSSQFLSLAFAASVSAETLANVLAANNASLSTLSGEFQDSVHAVAILDAMERLTHSSPPGNSTSSHTDALYSPEHHNPGPFRRCLHHVPAGDAQR